MLISNNKNIPDINKHFPGRWNLIKNDSTNVRLGLSVTENINSIGFSKLRTPNANTDSAPSMSVLNQLGTILYGTNIPYSNDPNSDYQKKRLKLEIYYTKPKPN